MKRFLVIPIMFMYMLAVPGVLIHVHYCGKTIESWSLYDKSGCEDGDDCDDEKQADGCCKDKVISSKVSHDQHIATLAKVVIHTEYIAGTLVNYPVMESAIIRTDANIGTTNQPNAPPGLWQNIPLYKLHSRLTYYG